MTSVIETEVLIIGAGPAGLMAANELQKRGIQSVCLEKRSGPVMLPKALGIQARTLELLEFLGIHERFLKRGYPGPGSKLHLAGQKPSFVELYHIKSHYPYLFILPQNEIEELFVEYLSEMGGTVHWEHEVVDAGQDMDGVTVRAVHNGETKLFRAKYLLACDGAHSKIRQIMDIDFVGEDEGFTFFTADVDIPGLKEIHINMHLNDRGAVAIFPYKGGNYRVVGLDRAMQNGPRKNALTLYELQDSLNRILDQPYQVENPTWLSVFGTAHRQVEQYRHGRIFFLGDAAHINNPLGGQGMNLGLEDASNLCWRLAAVLKGYAGDGVLDQYHSERYPIARSVIRDTSTELKMINFMGPTGRLRNWAGKAALTQDWIQKRIAHYLSHIHHEYHKTSFNKKLRDKGLSRHAVQSGERVPDQHLFFDGNPDHRLYPLIREHGYTGFIYIDCYDEELIAYANEFSKKVQEAFPDLVKIFLIARGGIVLIDGEEFPIIYDVHRGFERKLGMEKGSTLLLRPDGHVAFHDTSANADRVMEKLQRFFTNR